MEGLMGGNLRFRIDWASFIVGSKFTVFASFYFVFEGNFPSTSSPGDYIWRGDSNGGFFALPLWGAYIWRGLFSEFYGVSADQCKLLFSIACVSCMHMLC